MQGTSRLSPTGMGYGYGGAVTVEIPLDEELLGSFCRRGRRRLRELQDATQTIVRLDRTRACLSVTGTESGAQSPIAFLQLSLPETCAAVACFLPLLQDIASLWLPRLKR